MYKTERKSMLELNNDSKNLQYQLKGIGIGVEFHGGFWAEYVYLSTEDGYMVRILANGVVYMNQGWYALLNEAEKYLVDEYIDYIKRWI